MFGYSAYTNELWIALRRILPSSFASSLGDPTSIGNKPSQYHDRIADERKYQNAIYWIFFPITATAGGIFFILWALAMVVVLTVSLTVSVVCVVFLLVARIVTFLRPKPSEQCDATGP